MAIPRLHVGFLLVPLFVGCTPPYDPPLPLPPPPAPAVLRTPEEEWAPWEGNPWQGDTQSPQTPPASASADAPDAQAPQAAPTDPGVPPWQKQGGPLPPLPNQVPRYAPTSEPPAAAEWVRPYASGQWVHTSEYGWIWVPSGATATAMDGVPYTYLYTPRYGWTWYLSPWGWGGYAYGAWVTHPWRPIGWHPRPWVAHPRVVIRLGGGHRPPPRGHRR